MKLPRLSLIVLTLLNPLPVVAEINISNAWLRLLPPMVKTSAAYMDIQSDQPDVLLSVYSEIAERVEIHESAMTNGMMSMSHLEKIVVPAGKKVALSSNGKHLMLIGLHKTLKEGDSYLFKLNFKHAGELEIIIPVENH